MMIFVGCVRIADVTTKSSETYVTWSISSPCNFMNLQGSFKWLQAARDTVINVFNAISSHCINLFFMVISCNLLCQNENWECDILVILVYQLLLTALNSIRSSSTMSTFIAIPNRSYKSCGASHMK
jgi:hypothetical protein